MMKKIAFFLLLALPVAGYAQDVKQLKRQAKAGSSEAAMALAHYYEEQDQYKKAAKYYEQAATPQADYELAALYINGQMGKGSDKETARGIALLRRSAAAGNRDGRYWLAYCMSRGLAGEGKDDSAFVLYSRLADEGDSMAMLQTAVAYDLGRGTQPDTARALQLYRKAGDLGVSNGYSFLGDFYRDGEYVAPNADSAFALYSRAYGLGGNNTVAALSLAQCHLAGTGTPRDTAAAIPYLMQAAGEGHPMAQGLLGDVYNYGWGGISPSADSALAYYLAAAQQDDPRGDYMVGAWLYDRGAYEQAIPYIVSAAENGNMDAMLLYCRASLFGYGVEAQPEQAYIMVRELTEVMEGGEAHTLLGNMHYSGIGCQQDYGQAVRYFDTAARLGDSQAMMFLGDLYARGEGVPRDTVEALQWYERAVAAGSLRAMKTLAASHVTGRLVPRDPKRAVELYQMAADRGDLEAMCRLGLCYETGEGVILNSRRAYSLYTEAAEKGSAFGKYLTAMCYVQGIYVQEDVEQAFQWMLQAAEGGHLDACYLTGAMYATGEGVKKNKKEARKWLSLAAENGHAPAADMLKIL
ncbi:MAG: sel1 repeat family protein [Bacteroidales bacterium]|nr:sel1 repeat family protein [Bacteroidales bacterium]